MSSVSKGTLAAGHSPDDTGAGSSRRLDLLKALGDNTRYAIYLEIARSPAPLATADVAKTLDLHVNTVRPHLERMRELGLLEVYASGGGGVGRPQHKYSIAHDAPSLGLEPPLFPTLARMLLKMAATVGAEAEDATNVGREQGADSGTAFAGQPCDAALLTELDRLGFDPSIDGTDEGVTVGFDHCPFQDLAEANPDLVCGLHKGMVEGFVDSVGGGEVTSFRTLTDRKSCQVDLTVQ